MADSKQKGVTLIELLVALVILMIVVSFALPTYQGYVETSQEGVVRANIMSMEIFQEDFFLRNGEYANDLANVSAIEAEIGWKPKADDDTTYSIAASDGSEYDVTAVHPDGLSVCIRFPDRETCP